MAGLRGHGLQVVLYELVALAQVPAMQEPPRLATTMTGASGAPIRAASACSSVRPDGAV
ncbi:hypothetical protein ABZ915_44180 [Streptomyces sp. NPDC046915]|uniref:hypothetical protein n=1 Tax=Streptomyces sp. NPDC046915 TaxID=3155257 RepID=UPI0033FBCCF0